MPKKFKGDNSKAVEARARKDAQKQAEHDQKQKEKDDEFWRDDDKHVARKQQRKGDREKKRLEQLEKKKELQQLHDEEMSQLKSAKPPPAVKLTRAEITSQQEHLAAAATAAAEKTDNELMHDEKPLSENVNRLVTEGDEARTVEDAISMLSVKQEQLERHPEKRVKAAYTSFEDENLPKLKIENPNLRLSQLKQILKKEWQKSPENPLNQRHITYNNPK